MLYAMSDIHGCFNQLEERLGQIHIREEDKLIFLGDYIDYGPQSAKVLQTVIHLQETLKEGSVIALKGNHEDMLLSWLKECRRLRPGDSFIENDWLGNDRAGNYRTFRTMVTKDQLTEFLELEEKTPLAELNKIAAEMMEKTSGDLVQWIGRLPLNYETDTQIFVHAGVDEEAEDFWKIGTPDEIFLWKYPPAKGEFYKNIIAGHIGTYQIADEKDFHSVYYDGESHYYIDGTVYEGGRLCLLAYDDRKDIYYEIDDDGNKIKLKKKRRIGQESEN